MRILLPLILFLLIASPAFGQDVLQPELQRHSWDVFVKLNAEDPSLTDVIFIDLLTGEESIVSTPGDHFTLTGSGVIFFDTVDRQVRLAKADGIIRDHPFITMTADAYRVDWTVSADRQRIAWTVSRKRADDQLVTSTWLADIAGREVRELLVYGPRDGIQLLPIAIDESGDSIFMEVHADGTSGLTPYTKRTGLFSLVVVDDVLTRAVPGDQTCFCAVGFGGGKMLRLTPNDETGGLDVEVYDLNGGPRQVILAISRGNYSEAGNVLLSPDGSQAVYALSQVSGFATEQEEIRTVMVQIDLENARQKIVGSPIPALVRPLSFTEDNRVVLFTTERGSGTWKIDLEDGQLVEVSSATYLGMLGGS